MTLCVEAIILYIFICGIECQLLDKNNNTVNKKMCSLSAKGGPSITKVPRQSQTYSVYLSGFISGGGPGGAFAPPPLGIRLPP